MEEIIRAFKNQQPHHAYIIAGDLKNSQSQVLNLLTNQLGLKTFGNPDVFVRTYDIFGINESRLIRLAQKNKALSGDHKFFILAINSITTEAQNALLKTLEEPTAGTHFFILVRRADDILPTVRSRCEIFEIGHGLIVQPAEQLTTVKEFLNAKTMKKMEIINRLLSDDNHRQNKTDILSFLDGLETAIRQTAGREATDWPVAKLEKIITARKFIQSRGGFPRLTLEDLALNFD